MGRIRNKLKKRKGITLPTIIPDNNLNSGVLTYVTSGPASFSGNVTLSTASTGYAITVPYYNNSYVVFEPIHPVAIKEYKSNKRLIVWEP